MYIIQQVDWALLCYKSGLASARHRPGVTQAFFPPCSPTDSDRFSVSAKTTMSKRMNPAQPMLR